MEADFKSTQRFVTPIVWHSPKNGKNLIFGPKIAILNHFNTHFQQYTYLFISLTAFLITFGQIQIFKKKCVILL